MKLVYNIKMSNYYRFYLALDTAYKWSRGMTREEQTAFEKDVYPKIEAAGYILERPKDEYSCPRIKKDGDTRMDLYLHPMEITGLATEEQMNDIRSILKRCTTIKATELKSSDQIEDLDEKDYLEILENNRDEIIAWIKESKKNDGFAFAKQYRPACFCLSSISIYGSTDLDVKYVTDLYRQIYPINA